MPAAKRRKPESPSDPCVLAVNFLSGTTPQSCAAGDTKRIRRRPESGCWYHRRSLEEIMGSPSVAAEDAAVRAFLRHTLATLAYRGGKAVRGAPDSFAGFEGAGRTPAQILAHIGDLFDWALSIARGTQKWNDSQPLPWPQEVERFHRTLGAFDEYLASGATLHASAGQLFQGPIADALTHVGQIAMLRRMAGCKITGENYFVADIAAGRVGADQAAPRKQF